MSLKLKSSGNQQVKLKLSNIKKGISNPKPLLKRIGVLILNEVNKNFVRGSNDGNAWTPNAPATIARKGSSKPLIDTGNLRASFTYQVKRNSVEIGSPVFYSEFHEFGTSTIPQRKMLPKDSKASKIAVAQTKIYLKTLANRPV